MKFSLARLTLTAWLAWLIFLSIMVWLSCRRILHPSCIYLTIPLVVLVISTVAVLGGGIWRVIRGPQQWNAVAWMLFAALPALWMASYAEYLLIVAAGHNLRRNALTTWADAAVPLVVEPCLRMHYPYRYEGERFVMWSDAPECDMNQMAAMDAHIRAMEEALGRRPSYKVYWVRGPVWGITGRGGAGWALGSSPSTHGRGMDQLDALDRHEVAHFVLDEFCPSGSEVPMLFHEGWAELHSKPKPESHWQECWASQSEGKLPSLRALTSPACYYHSLSPMYSIGSVVVEYVLKRFGHEKFLELCCTCREATFSDDVQRVLGLNLDELDRAYQQDLARRQPSTKERLLSAKLADGVDATRWGRLVEDLCAGMERLQAAFDQSSVTVVEVVDKTEKNGQTASNQHRFEYYFDGKRYASRRSFPEYSDVSVRTPDVVFGLKKKPGEKSWRLNGYSVRNREKDVEMPVNREIPLFLWYRLGAPPPWWPCGPGLTITGLRRRC